MVGEEAAIPPGAVPRDDPEYNIVILHQRHDLSSSDTSGPRTTEAREGTFISLDSLRSGQSYSPASDTPDYIGMSYQGVGNRSETACRHAHRLTELTASLAYRLLLK